MSVSFQKILACLCVPKTIYSLYIVLGVCCIIPGFTRTVQHSYNSIFRTRNQLSHTYIYSLLTVLYRNRNYSQNLWDSVIIIRFTIPFSRLFVIIMIISLSCLFVVIYTDHIKALQTKNTISYYNRFKPKEWSTVK